MELSAFTIIPKYLNEFNKKPWYVYKNALYNLPRLLVLFLNFTVYHSIVRGENSLLLAVVNIQSNS